MRHFPIFLDMDRARVLMSGGGETALAKLRLLLKTKVRITLFSDRPAPEIVALAREGRLQLRRRILEGWDIPGATLVYAANDDDAMDARTVALARGNGVLVNWVDNLEMSDFITPAMVNRDPLTVAIGTEGAAPMLARRIKADLEERLPVSLGQLTRAAQAFRDEAEALPAGRSRRDFWAEWFDRAGPAAQDDGVELSQALRALLATDLAPRDMAGRVTLTTVAWADPELLTLKARKAIDSADVVVHDAAVASAVLDLARREARRVALDWPTDVPPLPQMLTRAAAEGDHVLYLSAGPVPETLISGCRAAGVDTRFIPGLPGPDCTNLKETA